MHALFLEFWERITLHQVVPRDKIMKGPVLLASDLSREPGKYFKHESDPGDEMAGDAGIKVFF